ncbi:unnamed protein product [Rotaria sp. Silwood1]|nr:unnamed protein product [Rotaria sp. Silwood1]CAF1331289.1 unnamed protein product [Rotaria sp. Silwood1]CAF4930804.1 unnamed protein product [Rotaria sp. Silwood1]
MKFEQLPNELILDVFEYLDAIDLLHAFYGLNCRFNKLLNISFKFYHLNFRSVSKYTFTIVCQQHLSTIINKIVSFYLADDEETPNLSEIFLSYNFTFNQFIHLKSLSIQSIQSIDLLNKIILQCHQLLYLTHLKLIECFINNNENDLINNIWNLPKLINCHIDNMMSKGICFTKLLILSSSIKYLSIKNINCDFRYLSHVFKQTPYLQQLCTTIICTEKNEKLQTSIPFLKNLNLSFQGSIATMINLFQIMFNLRSLTLSTSYLLLNGNEWKKILIQFLPNLKIFQLKMDFHFSQSNNVVDKIDQLLNTFQTNFWIQQHQWFVRCDWNPSNVFSHAILYTLPYAFNDFNFINESCSKSTCPNEEDYLFYNQVQNLQHESNISNNFEYFPIKFLNISHLEIILPFNEKFLFNIPSLNHLISLDVTLLPEDSVYNQLQLLLNRAPYLHLLRFSHVSDLEIILFKFQNTSIRRLDFFTKESMLYSWYFNQEQCIALANSSLGRQCQTLVIDIKDRTYVNDLINNMSNLQSLIFHCKDDKWNHKTSSSSTNDELIQWLHEHLPSTCSISRNINKTSILQVWIR